MLLILLLLVVVFIVYSTNKLQLHPFLALLISALAFGILSGMPLETLIASINEGFGKTLGSIGLLIIIGVIIGTFLEHTGGAHAIATKLISIIGEKRLTPGMAFIGYLISIPVFADSGFILLSPLNKEITAKAKKSLSVTAIALALGLMASHTMVPPTPGPIAAAGIIGASIGLVILYGLVVSMAALVPCILYAEYYGRKVYIDPLAGMHRPTGATKPSETPSAGLALLPILIPILLIVSTSLNDFYHFIESGWFFQILNFIGTPFISLCIGLLFALLLPKKLSKSMLSEEGWVGKALKDAAIIIMITGAGGIFGKVLQNAGLSDVVAQYFQSSNIGIALPFLLAAAIKSAQGSSTVAMITTASILAPLLTDLGLDHPSKLALTVVAIGAGSAVVSHANDSFFWVVTRMSNMTVSQGYRIYTTGTLILGLSSFVIVLILSTLV